MKNATLNFCLAILAVVALAGVASADTMSSSVAAAPTIVTPDSLTWTPVKGIDGAQMAVVYGDPTKAGSVYTMRLKLADGTKVPIHWHDQDERVTVLSGTFMVGVGHSFDMASMKALGPGSFVFVPAGVHHYAMAKGETIVQVTGPGPFTMNMMK
jgi:quercetin dioxygenase-like cupin family protein